MLHILTFKLTTGERDMLDWLEKRMDLDSRTEVIIECLKYVANIRGMALAQQSMLGDERANHPTRRSKRKCRLIGPRWMERKRQRPA